MSWAFATEILERRIRTPLCKTLAVVTQTDEREAGRGYQRDKRRDGHATEEGPIDKGEAVDSRVEHHRPRKDKDKCDGKECPGQPAPLAAHREPALQHSYQCTGTDGYWRQEHTIVNQGINHLEN